MDFCTIYIRPTSASFSLKDGARPIYKDGRLPDELRFVKFTSIDWTPDSKGFFYKVSSLIIRALADYEYLLRSAIPIVASG
jgi:hypothetical protein